LPTVLKVLRGTYRASRANVAEPQPQLGAPPKPPRLSPLGAEVWDELARQLKQLKVLTRADGHALELACEALAEWRAALDVVQREGTTYKAVTKSGSVLLPHPSVRQAADAWRRAQRMLVEFGLTPSSRTRVSVPPDAARGGQNPFRQLQRGRRRGGRAG
jgi:P27 family predicted phage terminase small subunit